ncbi:hypothetical protein K6119_18270 [Paracrocinitomix mangrovi]|uniref:hypothetical protein n=1 Tax=Paracrocinitomix mangrovi TaxID=2862509 RepID=UPI001C8DC996|nr:hypothetical protein [Paracrocinitomix mangrovi]UKN01672.1 hypothetical protein K6119_18270 [Paracrocinitomix mangrovi]
MHKQRMLIVGGGALAIVAAFLPWISISFFGMTVRASGISAGLYDGWIVLGLGAAVAGLAFTQGDRNAELDATQKKTIAGMGGAIVGYMLFFMFVRAQGGFGALGIGVYIALLSGIAVLAAPFVIKGDGNFEMPTKDTIKADLDGTGDDSTSTEA